MKTEIIILENHVYFYFIELTVWKHQKTETGVSKAIQITIPLYDFEPHTKKNHTIGTTAFKSSWHKYNNYMMLGVMYEIVPSWGAKAVYRSGALKQN